MPKENSIKTNIHLNQVGKMELGWCDTALVLPYAAIQILYPGIADRCFILWKKLNDSLALSPQVWP